MDLRNGDCLEILKDIDDKSVDLVFADLPYGQVNCKWDCKIDLELLWKELLRVAKSPSTPFFFTCTTKFGYELIKSNEKMFKYDLVWAKSNPCGFLQAKKQPMRKHEMIYVFYKKQPLYDISSHKHKFLKEKSEITPKENSIYGDVIRNPPKQRSDPIYEPPLPTSVIKEEGYKNKNGKKDFNIDDEDEHKDLYGKWMNDGYRSKQSGTYDPPLPNSVLEIKSIRLKQHSTAKPPDLMKWILKYYTKEGDVVLDPTMGSNPMGLACKEMNRNYIGIEKDPEIYDFACSRVEY